MVLVSEMVSMVANQAITVYQAHHLVNVFLKNVFRHNWNIKGNLVFVLYILTVLYVAMHILIICYSTVLLFLNKRV
jgi:hypothetical protein